MELGIIVVFFLLVIIVSNSYKNKMQNKVLRKLLQAKSKSKDEYFRVLNENSTKLLFSKETLKVLGINYYIDTLDVYEVEKFLSNIDSQGLSDTNKIAIIARIFGMSITVNDRDLMKIAEVKMNKLLSANKNAKYRYLIEEMNELKRKGEINDSEV